MRLLKNELDRRGIVSKIRVSRKGSKSGGQPFSRGALYELLANPIYIGEVRHRNERHSGQHEPILERKLWEKTQRVLRDGAARDQKTRSKAPSSPLTGKLFDENGQPLYVQGAAKGKRRYRYYVSRALVRGAAEHTGRGWRIPAPEIERAVTGVAKAFLDDRAAVLAALQESGIETPEIMDVLKLAEVLSRRLTSETGGADTLTEITDKVQLTAGGLRVGLKISVPKIGNESSVKALRVTRLVSLKMKRRGVEMRIVLGGYSDMARKADPALLKAVARARRWFEEIASARVRSSAEIAGREALPKGYVAAMMRLAFLSPTLADAVVEGRAPLGISLQRLVINRVALPLRWSEQDEWLTAQVRT